MALSGSDGLTDARGFRIKCYRDFSRINHLYFKRLFDALNEAGEEHLSKIRTSLGHPENKEELAMLEKKERDRQFKAVKVR